MIDVLLVSPRLPSTHPRYGGDNAYTDMLLQHPPPGVRYHHYEDLLATGQVRKLTWLYRIGPRLVKYGILPPDLWAEYLASDFVPDVLHIYGFSAVVRFPESPTYPPVVLGMSTGSYSDLKFYLGWEDARVHRARRMKRLYLRLIDAHDSSLRPERACRVHIWSEFSRRMHLEEGYVRPEQIEVLYPGLPASDGRPREKTPFDKVTFLFIGRDFVRKNGMLVLKAFRQVRERCSRAELILVSQLPDGRQLSEEGVVHYPFLTRRELQERIYPYADVLVLPSRAEGFGLVLLEAMSFGMPVIAVNAWAMPEIVQDGVNGYLIPPGSLEALTACMERIAQDREQLQVLSQGARRVFQERFALQYHNARLRQIYEEALSAVCC
ncbi:MAG: glycosyltransferase family 4 protein [Anaerolineae bacterium]